MKNKLLIALLVAGFIAIGLIGEKVGSEKQYLNPHIPNKYAPNHKPAMNQNYFLKVMKKDLETSIDKVVVLKPDRARKLYPFRIEALNGEFIDNDDLPGKVTVVIVWSTVKQDSVEDAQSMVRVAEQFSGDDLRVIGFATKGSEGKVREMLEDGKLNYPTVYTEGAPPVDYRFFPTYIFLDREGRIRVFISHTLSGETRRKIIDYLLK